MNLKQWAQTFGTVEDGGGTERVRLADPNGETWATWERVDIIKPDWPERADEYVATLVDELTVGSHTVTFYALDRAGAVRGQLPRHVIGRRPPKPKGERVSPELNALAESMQSLSKTARVMLEAQNEFIQQQQATITKVLESNARLVDELRVEREASLHNSVTGDNDPLTEMVTQAIGQNLGPILEMVPDVLKAYSKKQAAVQATARVVKKASKAMNGVTRS